jgi:hypothetical protein
MRKSLYPAHGKPRRLSLPDGHVVRPDDVPDEVGQTVEVDVTGEC